MNFEVCSRVADTIFTFQAENLGAKIPRAEACKLIGARGSGVETGFLFFKKSFYHKCIIFVNIFYKKS